MKTNKEWHEQHRMPKNLTFEERLHWHSEHTKHCSCREMPEKLAKEIKQRSKGKKYDK